MPGAPSSQQPGATTLSQRGAWLYFPNPACRRRFFPLAWGFQVNKTKLGKNTAVNVVLFSPHEEITPSRRRARRTPLLLAGQGAKQDCLAYSILEVDVVPGSHLRPLAVSDGSRDVARVGREGLRPLGHRSSGSHHRSTSCVWCFGPKPNTKP